MGKEAPILTVSRCQSREESNSSGIPAEQYATESLRKDEWLRGSGDCKQAQASRMSERS